MNYVSWEIDLLLNKLIINALQVNFWLNDAFTDEIIERRFRVVAPGAAPLGVGGDVEPHRVAAARAEGVAALTRELGAEPGHLGGVECVGPHAECLRVSCNTD